MEPIAKTDNLKQVCNLLESGAAGNFASCVTNNRHNQIGFNQQHSVTSPLEHFLLSWNQFNLGILQGPLGFNGIQDGYGGSNQVKNAPTPLIDTNNSVERSRCLQFRPRINAVFSHGHCCAA